MNLLAQLLGRGKKVERRSLDYMTYNGLQYPIIGSTATLDREEIENNFVGYIRGACKSNGVVFACMLARLAIFSQIRFMFQEIQDNGKLGDLFGPRDQLRLLETPWPNADTGELLSRMIQDVDLSGNFYAVREKNRLRRLRPDWVEIVLTTPPSEAVESDVQGYLYRPGGRGSSVKPTPYFPEQICHWSPIPDPEAQYRGMSWLTPIVREILADKYATEHKISFFENGATLQTVLSLRDTTDPETFATFLKMFNESHQGLENAYEPLVVAGVDVTTVGTDLKQLEFKVTQGAGETRIAADSGIHPVIIGLSEGLQGSSLNAGNFNSARRLTANKTMQHLWQTACAALSTVVPPPANARLWFDRDIPILQDDQKDRAEIQAKQAQTIRTLWDGGWQPESIKTAVMAYDWGLLEHTGLAPVQAQPENSGTDESEQDAEGDE